MWMPLLAIAAMSQTIGSFTFAQKEDPVTGQTQAAAIVQGDGAALRIGCNLSDVKGVTIAFVPERSMKTAGTNILTFRFDQGKPEYGAWNIDYHIAHIKKAGAVGAFAKRMLTASKLAMRFDGLDDQPVDGVFELRDTAAAFDRVATACSDEKFRAALR